MSKFDTADVNNVPQVGAYRISVDFFHTYRKFPRAYREVLLKRNGTPQEVKSAVLNRVSETIDLPDSNALIDFIMTGM